jgi:hypothetical protein
MGRQGSSLAERLGALGRSLGGREAAHGAALEQARTCAERLRADVDAALERFHEEAASAGASHLRVVLGPVRPDDKHLRSIEFDLERGRHRAIVTVKSRGEVTLVGPFRAGRDEGPCLTFPWDSEEEIQEALGIFLERFLEEAATP